MKTYKKELLSIAIGFGFFYTCLNLVCGQDIFVGLKNAQGEKTPFKQLFSKATTGEISGEKYFKLINNEKYTKEPMN